MRRIRKGKTKRGGLKGGEGKTGRGGETSNGGGEEKWERGEVSLLSGLTIHN